MSLKKDKSLNKDKYFMNIAMNLAVQRNGLTGLNPSVGCVIVKNNKIISFGQTGFKGRPHAESDAISKCKKKDLRDSSIYITMEPCNHFGKTPPCTNLIIKSKIKRVIYSINDVDERTSNKAYSFLKNKYISKIVIGFENSHQLRGILLNHKKIKITCPSKMQSNDLNLINPTFFQPRFFHYYYPYFHLLKIIQN